MLKNLLRDFMEKLKIRRLIICLFIMTVFLSVYQSILMIFIKPFLSINDKMQFKFEL